MSLKNNLQEKLSKNGHALDEFFFFYFNLDFDRIAHSHYGISLKSHEGIWLCATDELFKKKYRYGFKICCQRRYEIVDISSFDRDTFRIQIFLDQYGYLGRQLPVFSEEVIASNLIWQNKYKTYDEVRQAMQIMLKPLNTYDDFIERVKEIEVFRQWQIIRPEMLPLGNINDWSWGILAVNSVASPFNKPMKANGNLYLGSVAMHNRLLSLFFVSKQFMNGL